MSRFFKQVVSLSKTPEDYKQKTTVSESPTDSVPPTEGSKRLVSISPTDSVPPTNSSHTSELARYSRPKPRLARIAQDGHSHAEQAVYAALWDGGSPDVQGNRTITIGFGKLSRQARLSENNCRINTRSLLRKLALEEIGEENSRASIGKTYRVFNYSAILQRRKAAGLEWILRTKGVAFVRPDGTPLDVVPPTESGAGPDSVGGPVSIAGNESAPDSPTESGPAPPTESVPPYRKLFRKELQEPKTSSPSVIENTARKYGIILDDDILRRMQKNCKLNEPSASEEEIAYMLEVKILQLKDSRSIQNLPAVLVNAVANLFPSNELHRYRAQKNREQIQSRELAQQILDDSGTSDKEREWARSILGEVILP